MCSKSSPAEFLPRIHMIRMVWRIEVSISLILMRAHRYTYISLLAASVRVVAVVYHYGIFHRKYSHKSCGFWIVRAKWFRLVMRTHKFLYQNELHNNSNGNNNETEWCVAKRQGEKYKNKMVTKTREAFSQCIQQYEMRFHGQTWPLFNLIVNKDNVPKRNFNIVTMREEVKK